MPRRYRARSRNHKKHSCRTHVTEHKIFCGKDASNRDRIRGYKSTWIYDPVNKKFITIWEALSKGLPFGKIGQRLEQNKAVIHNIGNRLSGEKTLPSKHQVTWSVSILRHEARRGHKEYKDPALILIYIGLRCPKSYRKYYSNTITIPGRTLPTREEIERHVMKAALELLHKDQVENLRHAGHRVR